MLGPAGIALQVNYMLLQVTIGKLYLVYNYVLFQVTIGKLNYISCVLELQVKIDGLLDSIRCG
jgi:hypothetical protein